MIHLEENQRNKVFICPGIIRFLFFLGKPAVVQVSEINLMKHHLNGLYNDIKLYSLIEGTHILSQRALFQGSAAR